MKISEFKLRIINSLNSLIDTYFNGMNINEKFINSTLKIIVKQNIHKLDSIFELFTDNNDEINLDMMVNEYANMIPENGFMFDLKKYIPNDFIKNMIPDKVLIIKREDVMSLLT